MREFLEGPAEFAFGVQHLGEGLSELVEVLHIQRGVVLPRFGKRRAGPILVPVAFLQFNTDETFDHRGEVRPVVADEARRELSIEKHAGVEPEQR